MKKRDCKAGKEPEVRPGIGGIYLVPVLLLLVSSLPLRAAAPCVSRQDPEIRILSSRQQDTVRRNNGTGAASRKREEGKRRENIDSVRWSGSIPETGKELLLQMEEVVVTGSRTPRALKEVPVVTRLITAAEIRREAPRSLTDLLEAELPGIEFTRTEGAANGVTFRGLDAGYLLILVDGERLAGETQRGNPDFSRIDISQVERIEIVKGAMSTLYGSGAVAGVINIITKGASVPFRAEASVFYDTEGLQKYGAAAGGKTRFRSGEKASVREFSAYTSAAGSIKERYFMQDTEIEGYENFSISQQLGYRAGERFSATLKGTFYAHQRYNAGKAGELMHDLYRDGNVRAKGEYRFDPANRLEFSYYWDEYSKYTKYFRLNETERNYRDVIHNPRVLFETEAIRKNTLVAGAEVLRETLDTYQFSDSLRKGSTRAAFFVQDDYRINNRITLQAGIRLDWDSGYGRLHASPRLSAMWRAGSWTFRAGYAAGFRAPTLKERYTSWDHQGMFVLVGNPDLKPEKSHNVQVSAEWTVGRANFSAGGYYNYIYDKISTIWNAAQDTSFYANVAHASLYGADANLRFRISRNLQLRAGYAYVRDRQRADGYNISTVRPHSATWRIEYNFRLWGRSASAGLSGRYLSGVTAYAAGTVLPEGLSGPSAGPDAEYVRTRYEGYSIWKLTCAGGLPGGLRLQLGINNLFDYKPEKVTYNAGITRGITFFAGLAFTFEKREKEPRQER